MTMDQQNKKRLPVTWLRAVPTLFLFLLGLGSLLWNSFYQSDQPEVFHGSLPLVFLLVASFMLTAYSCVSLVFVRLQNANNYLCYLGIFALISLEIIFQVKPDLVPGPLMLYLPKKTVERIRIAVAHKWGYYTGEDMIFHYPPYQQLDHGELKRPHVHIDEEGFRNPSQTGTEYNLVLLGDSMVFALDAKRDLADRFRALGYSAINLGMEGYAPQQFRDVYKKYIIDRDIRHNHVLLFLYIGNDFSDAEAYQWVRDKGGDYTDYVIGETKGIPQLPFVLNLIRGIPEYLLQLGQTGLNYGDFPASSEEYSEDMIEGRRITLPYDTLEVHDWLWPPPAINQDSTQWSYVRSALDDIIALAEKSGATPWIFLYPSPLTVYSDFEVGPPPNNSLRKFDRRHALIRDLLEKYAQSKNVSFFDYDSALKAEIEHTFLFVGKDDGHFNDDGLDKIFELLTKILSSAK
jgi:hypothetical protein